MWTSELKRTKQTAEFIHAPQVNWKALNEINAVSYLIMCSALRVVCLVRETEVGHSDKIVWGFIGAYKVSFSNPINLN